MPCLKSPSMTFYAPTLCLFYQDSNNTNWITYLSEQNVAYPCLLISIVSVNKQIKPNHQLTTLLIVYI